MGSAFTDGRQCRFCRSRLAAGPASFLFSFLSGFFCRPFRPALAAAFALMLAFAAPASAEVLVSNLKQPASSGVAPTPPAGGAIGYSFAQGFTTGSNPLGYTLTSIALQLLNGNDKQFRVELATGVSTSVGTYTSIAELTPESLGEGTKTFNAPANTVLSPDTEYFLVITTTRAIQTNPLLS